MFDRDIIKLAWMSLWRRKLRTILTMIGIMIGTAGIVTMIALGVGLERNFVKEFDDMNMNNIDVNIAYDSMDEEMGEETGGKIKTLNKEDVIELQKLDGVKVVTPIYQYYGELKIGRDRFGVQLVGVDMDVAKDLGYKLQDGRLPRNNEILLGNGVLENITGNTQEYTGEYTEEYTKEDTKKNISVDDIIRKPVKIITMVEEATDKSDTSDATDTQDTTDTSDTTNKADATDTSDTTDKADATDTSDTTNKSDATDKSDKTDSTDTAEAVEQMQQEQVENEYRSKIVGILKETGGQEDYAAILDIEKVIKIAEESRNISNIIQTDGYSTIKVVAENTEVVDQLSKEIKEMGYMPYSIKEMLNSFHSSFKFIQIFLGAIGSIALTVAAIGITNTMIMSIYERTKEIGVNKVIGASVKDVRTQFLYEASFIGLMGGVAGLIISYLVAFIINVIVGMIISAQPGMTEAGSVVYIPLWLAIFAITFSIIVGVLAGLYPANRAAKISVLEALRQE